MAMLQLGGTLSNATVRITPRASWWISAQHLLQASSVAASPNPAAENPKDEKFEKIENVVGGQQIQNERPKILRSRSLITAAFKSLLHKPNIEEGFAEKTSEVSKKINSATTVDELLNISNDSQFNIQNATIVIYVLCNWMATGKIVINDIEKDSRYIKICKMVGIGKTTTETFMRNRRDIPDNLEGILKVDKTSKIVENLDTKGMIKALSALASQQKRSAPLLQNIAKKLVSSKDELNIKQLADILYSMAVLNFYDEALMVKICKDLIKIIPESTGNAVIGSILTSMGLLRYRNEEIIDLSSSWIIHNQAIIRSQEVNSLLMTLAFVGYTPKNFNELYKNVIEPLKEGDMCQSSEWLDTVWALTILNKADNNHYESVLNDGFVNRLFNADAVLTSVPKALKLLNVNAAARLLSPKYKEPLLPEDSNIYSTTIMRTKEKSELSNSIISALKILLPSDARYLNININTNMGFLLDAEFCVDNKCTPLPVNSVEKQDRQLNRIAILSCDYHEHCRGTKEEVKGPIKLYRKLLEHQGYKVMLIPYSKVNLKDKLVTRAKYINDNIKILLEKKQ